MNSGECTPRARAVKTLCIEKEMIRAESSHARCNKGLPVDELGLLAAVRANVRLGSDERGLDTGVVEVLPEHEAQAILLILADFPGVDGLAINFVEPAGVGNDRRRRGGLAEHRRLRTARVRNKPCQVGSKNTHSGDGRKHAEQDEGEETKELGRHLESVSQLARTRCRGRVPLRLPRRAHRLYRQIDVHPHCLRPSTYVRRRGLANLAGRKVEVRYQLGSPQITTGEDRSIGFV